MNDVITDTQCESAGATVRSLHSLKIVRACGLDLAAIDFADAVALVDALVVGGEPHFFITANVNYAMLVERDSRLAEVNRKAAFIVADGMPLVWAAKLRGTPLPGRVTGSDLTPALCKLAAERGYPVFLLGGADGVGQQAAARLKQEFPTLNVAGIENPILDRLSALQTESLLAGIRASGARLVFVALGQPKGELWLAEHYRSLGPAVSVQIGATIDFAAGRVRRAPRWIQRVGFEWLYRLLLEPRRLAGRYAANAWFLMRQLPRSLLRVN